jgi:hypothetical protein
VLSLLPRCQGLWGSQKQAGTPVATLNRACWAVSLPWSQVKRPGRSPRRRQPYLGARPLEGRHPATTGLPSQAPVSRTDPQ